MKTHRLSAWKSLRSALALAFAVMLGAAESSGAPVAASDRLEPHFETIDGRRVLFVDGRPHVILAAEIPWWDIVWGRHQESLHVYDHLYPTARKMGLNALKVPVKWSLVEPRPGQFDFSYVDHVKSMAEKHGLKLVLCWFGHHGSSDGTIYYNLSGDVFAPMDIIRDEKTYPRAIDADGVAHHNAASYEHEAIVEREVAAFRAFMQHIKRTDAQTRTVLMIQVENEIAVFGWDRRNQKLWRDHSPVANRLFVEKGFRDDLRYSAWRLTTNWIKPVTDAGSAEYSIPFYMNFASGKLAEGMVGGSPGEDVATTLENCPAIAFVGLNPYLPGNTSVSEFRAALDEYRVGRNIVAISETNSDATPVAQRLAYLAIGTYGAPLFAPWSMTVSAPTFFQPYVREDGSLAHGAAALSECYRSLAAALPEIACFAGTDKLRVFMSDLPDKQFSETVSINGTEIDVNGWSNGQAIVIHPEAGEFIVVGYRCHISIHGGQFVWPEIEKVKVVRGRSSDDGWKRDGEPYFGFDQSNRKLNLYLETPQAIRVTFPASGADSQ